MRRTVRVYATNSPVWSAQFKLARTRCIGPLEMPLGRGMDAYSLVEAGGSRARGGIGMTRRRSEQEL
jgi:hypothetical protein